MLKEILHKITEENSHGVLIAENQSWYDHCRKSSPYLQYSFCIFSASSQCLMLLPLMNPTWAWGEGE